MNTTTQRSTAERRRRYRRVAAWSVLLMISLAMVLPLGGYLYVGLQDAYAQSAAETNPRSDLWRDARNSVAGYTAVQGQETGVLIQDGNNWRQLRNGYIANYGGWLLFGVLIVITLFFALRGSIKIDEGRSGVKIKRWNGFERFVHWCTATLFFILAVTGLSITSVTAGRHG